MASTLDLTETEAAKIIEAFKKSLGQPARPPQRPRDKQLAQALGREGRRGYEGATVILADQRSLALIREYRERLMWTEQEFQAWLRGPSSPLKGRTSIRTLGDARQVQWGMKKILKATGLWRAN